MVPPTTGDVGRLRRLTLSVTGINLSTRLRLVWRRDKTNISRLLDNASPGTRTTHGPAYCLPYEPMEMIIGLITHDLDTLKAFSLTCRSWYIAAVSHLQHTLTLRDCVSSTTRDELKLLSKLRRLGLIPLVEEIRVDQWHHQWFVPRELSRRDLRYFSAFTNVQTLKLRDLNISHFIPGVERYFGHFSPTLRSITLLKPHCTPRQLSHFLSLFSNLDDTSICGPIRPPSTTIPDTEFVPFSTPRLRGRLVLHDFNSVETWTCLTAAGGGPRFHYMELWKVGSCASVLFEACTETLETLRFYAMGLRPLSVLELNLSRFKVLRSLEVGAWATTFSPTSCTAVTGIFSTITSPVFSELIVLMRASTVTYLPFDDTLFGALRTMSQVRPFKLVFLIVDPDLFWGEAQRKLAKSLDLTAKGFLDFLDSPPTIRCPRFPEVVHVLWLDPLHAHAAPPPPKLAEL